jgi:hypothetical protein
MKTPILACATVLAATGLAGCVTMKDNYTPEAKQLSVPALNEPTTVSLGEDMLRQGTAVTTKGVLLRSQNKIGIFTLSPGFYPQTGEDEQSVYTSYATNKLDPDMGRVTGGGILPQGLKFEKTHQQTCVIYTGVYGITQKVCDHEYPYEQTTMPVYSSNSFQQTLIYSGRLGNKIKISYREFSGNMARGAFSNDAEYDLSTSDIIAYKGAKIKVLSADNQNIRYVVLSNFNSTE